MNDLQFAAPRSTPSLYSEARHGPTAPAGPFPYAKYLEIVRAHAAFILLVSLAFMLAGVLYAYLSPSVYQASIVIQVDDAPPPTDRVLGEAPKTLDLREATAPELEVLRSRLVVSRAVDALRLYIDVTPQRLPVIGQWVAGRHDSLSDPGLFGMGGYTWGSERATVTKFDVPAKFVDSPFVLTVCPDRTYTLASAQTDILKDGRVGVETRWALPGGEVVLMITELDAKPGAQFTLTRYARLESIETLQQSLKVAEQGKQSGVISVALDGSDPDRLAKILDEIGHQYLSQNEDRRSRGAQKSLAFLERELPELKASVEEAERRYNVMRHRIGSIDLGEEAKGLLQLTVAAKTKLIDLSQKRAELDGRYESAHPAMQSIDQQIGAVQRELAGVNTRIKRLPDVEQEIVRLSRDVKVNTEVYTAVMASAQQLRLAAANRVGNARLLDQVEVPVKPIKPRRLLIVGAATLFGLLLAVFASCARIQMRGGVGEPIEVERQLGLPVTGAIPHSPDQQALSARLTDDSRQSGPVLLQAMQPDDNAVESLRRLRTLLQRALERNDNHVVVITGPGAGVGKSFVAANLAAVLASTGKTVLLVDADLRTGHLHRTFAAPRTPGLAECLAGDIRAQQAVRAQVVPGVDLIPTGALPSNPAELLANDGLRALLQALGQRYDYILVDTAPVLHVSDALGVAPLAAATLNVVRSGVTTAEEIDETARQLRQAGAQGTGIVVNDLRSRSARYGYGYG